MRIKRTLDDLAAEYNAESILCVDSMEFLVILVFSQRNKIFAVTWYFSLR